MWPAHPQKIQIKENDVDMVCFGIPTEKKEYIVRKYMLEDEHWIEDEGHIFSGSWSHLSGICRSRHL